MKIILNILHYCIYNLHYGLHLFFNKINPFMLIHKMPFQKRRYKELGINIQENINTAFGDKRSGLSIMVAGGALIGIVFLILLTLGNLLLKATGVQSYLTIYHFIVFAVLSVMICYLYVFKNEEYLICFSEFERWPKSKKMNYNLLTLFFIIFVAVSFICSLMLG